MKKILITFSFLLIWLNGITQWEPTNGPYGGSAKSMVINNSTLFVATDCGVYSTTNDGIVWELRSNGIPACTPIESIILINNRMLVGTTNNGVYISDDNGQNWTESSTGLNNLSTYCLFKNGNELLLSTQGGIYKSNDDGNNWSFSSIGIPTNIGAISRFTKLGSTIFACHLSQGIFKSTDNGFSWSLCNTDLTSTSVSSILAVGSSLLSTTSNGLYVSTNNGSSWSASGSNLPSSCWNLYTNGTTIYCNANGGLYKSTNNGTSWSQIGNVSGSSFEYANSKLYVGFVGTSQDINNGVYVATNSESNWKSIGLGRGNSVNVVFKDVNNLYAGSNNGFYYSNDEGNIWSAINGNLPINTVVKCITKMNNILFIGTEKNGVFKSTDNGTTWTSINSGLTETSLLVFHNIRAIEAIGNELYIGANSLSTGPSAPLGKIFKSTNMGVNWTNICNGINGGSNYTYVTDIHSFGPAIFVSTGDGSTGDGVFISTNNGNSWISVNSGMPITSVYALASNGTNIFAGQYDATSSINGPFGGVFVSSDYGSSWGNNNYFSNETVYSLLCINNRTFGGSRYVLISDDNGLTWQSSGAGLPVTRINSLAGDPSVVYAGMGYGDGVEYPRGVYKYGGFLAINEPQIESQKINVYPNPFNDFLIIKEIISHEKIKYQIYNNLSTIVSEGIVEDNIISGLNTIPAGVYFLKIFSENTSYFIQIIK